MEAKLTLVLQYSVSATIGVFKAVSILRLRPGMLPCMFPPHVTRPCLTTAFCHHRALRPPHARPLRDQAATRHEDAGNPAWHED